MMGGPEHMGGNAPQKLVRVPNEMMFASSERSLAQALSGSLQSKAADLFAQMSDPKILDTELDRLIEDFNELGIAQTKEGAFATLAAAQIIDRTLRLMSRHEILVNRSTRGVTTLKRIS